MKQRQHAGGRAGRQASKSDEKQRLWCGKRGSEPELPEPSIPFPSFFQNAFVCVLFWGCGGVWCEVVVVHVEERKKERC